MHRQIQGWREDLRPPLWTILDPPLRCSGGLTSLTFGLCNGPFVCLAVTYLHCVNMAKWVIKLLL